MKPRKSKIEQLEYLKDKEKKAIERRRSAEAKLTKDEQKQRTRALVCLGVLVSRLMEPKTEFYTKLVEEARNETIQNRIGLGKYWPDFMPTQDEIDNAKVNAIKKGTSKKSL